MPKKLVFDYFENFLDKDIASRINVASISRFSVTLGYTERYQGPFPVTLGYTKT